MSTKTIQAVCVWPPEATEAGVDEDSWTWIVSLDELDAQGRAVTTRTLDVCDDRDEAIESAVEEARARGLPVYENGESSPATLLMSAADCIGEAD